MKKQRYSKRLTLSDFSKHTTTIKRQGTDLETKIEELKDVNQVLREKDKVKEDIIANLSDKLIRLSERLDASRIFYVVFSFYY